MKQNILTSALLLILFWAVAIGCKKDKPSQPITPGFSWKFQNTMYQSNIDTAFASPGNVRDYIIIGGTGLSVSNYMIGPRFDCNTLAPGSYPFTTEISDGGVIMNYMHITGEIYDALSGTLIITAKKDGRISGSFSGILYNGVTNEAIGGSFNDVPVGN